MRYANIIENDVCDSDDGIAVSLFFQYCPHHCKGCFNSSTWSRDGGMEIDTNEMIDKLKQLIIKNGVHRNLSFLGGEPLVRENIVDCVKIMKALKEEYPWIKVFLWTGYTKEELDERSKAEPEINEVYNLVDTLIDGRFEEDKRDITLKLRGSSNQRIFRKINGTLQEKY